MATNLTPAFPPARKDPRQVGNTLKRTLNFNDGDIAQFSFANSLPLGAFILSVQAFVVTAFAGGTGTAITIGTNSTTFNNISASGTIVPGTVGMYTPVIGLGPVLAASADTPVFGTLTFTGGPLTAGQVVIVIEFEGGYIS